MQFIFIIAILVRIAAVLNAWCIRRNGTMKTIMAKLMAEWQTFAISNE